MNRRTINVLRIPGSNEFSIEDPKTTNPFVVGENVVTGLFNQDVLVTLDPQEMYGDFDPDHPHQHGTGGRMVVEIKDKFTGKTRKATFTTEPVPCGCLRLPAVLTTEHKV